MAATRGDPKSPRVAVDARTRYPWRSGDEQRRAVTRLGRHALQDTSTRDALIGRQLGLLLDVIHQELEGPLGMRLDQLPTLEAYIARQGRTKETAAALGVHQNTVKYRLRELQAHAGPQLADPERAGALLLAVRLRRLLGDAR